ncbi:unnamed protein product [Chilo suppressalis]|uniref:Bee-milk protein n=1 Tax=Chilo suppressalis TaxID=168631 RepID=A0ABN8L5J4_CHISP|nr:unnamed protein product [Chilo suppressalis]
MIKICSLNLLLFVTIGICKYSVYARKHEKLKEVFSWKQIGYKINGYSYRNSSDYEYKPHAVYFEEDLEERERFFIQPNNVPIGFEVYNEKIFVTVPRRRYGIPSTLNYVTRGEKSPYLKPYPDMMRSRHLFSVYRPRVDVCDRLWMVDTGHLEVPNDRRQIQPPSIVIFDLKTDTQIHKHVLDPSVLVSNRTSAGLTSITVDVDPHKCDDAYAYINDLATEGLVVYSLKEDRSWRLEHPSFRHNDAAMNFTAAGHVINWRDGLFSVALARRLGNTLAYYHPLVSTQEFAISTNKLKTGGPLDELNPVST